MSDEETRTEADKVINNDPSDDKIDEPIDDLSDIENNISLDKAGKTTPERNNKLRKMT